jgi:hypothetical protein
MKKSIRSFLLRSWWLIAFLCLCAILYEEGLKTRDILYQQLTDQQRILRGEKLEALHRRENLQRQINSQSDLNWVELTLMKGLGLVPEGQQKVYFYEEKD